jgi:autotransporter adhesin
MSFGTGANTYTMPGIASAASTAAQSGPIDVVTTDLNGNLAAVNFTPIFGQLNNEIHANRQEARAGTALAIATAQIRYDDRPGKFSVGAGFGGFIDQAGGALGVGYTAPSGAVRVNFSGGGTSKGDAGVGAGIGLTFN